MKAAIAIDDWKLPIFSKHLVEAGFHYEQGPGPSKGTYLLMVTTSIEFQQKLAQVVYAANKEARKVKNNKP